MSLQTRVGRSGNRPTADNESLIFGPRSASNVSRIIQIDHDPLMVKAYNLGEGDEVRVEMVDGDGGGTMFAPFCPSIGQSALTNAQTVLVIGIPGRYRLILHRSDGERPSIGLVSVYAQTAVMSHDWLVAYLSVRNSLLAAGGSAHDPAVTKGNELTTNIIGSRSALMGTPTGWLDIGGGRKLPYWKD